MASSWNAIRDEACDEVEIQLQSIDPGAKEALEYARKHVQVFRTLAVYLRKSAKAKNRMISVRKKVQQDKNKYISLDCPTRWNSSMDMLQSFSDLQTTVNSFFDYLDTADGKKEFAHQTLQRPTQENWFVLRCLLALLHPFKAVTEEISGSEYPTLPITIPALRQIKTHLLKLTLFDKAIKDVAGYIFTDDAVAKMHKVRQAFLAMFLDRFSTVASDITWISCLDPRLTEMAHLRPAEKGEAQRALVEALLEVEVTPPASNERVERPPSPTTTPQKVRRDVRLGMYGSRAVAYEEPPAVRVDAGCARAACVQEFHDYLAAAKGVAPNSDPLEWWRAHKLEFPRIAQLARRWLGCVATSVPSERAFSTSGRVVSVHRCSLKEELVRDTVFIATNIKKKKAKNKERNVLWKWWE